MPADASVGAVLADADADIDEVLTAADSAMYVVKRQHQAGGAVAGAAALVVAG